jgi:hypothetical protein
MLADYDWSCPFLKSTVSYVDLIVLNDPYCGVCKGRNGMLRLHNPLIHFDESSPDLLDERVWWGKRHREEEYHVPA